MAKTIELTEPIKGHRGQPIKAVTLREPKYLDYMELGLPVAWISLESGGFEQEEPSLIQRWIERLCDCDPNFLPQLNLRDTLALRNAVTSFFREALNPGEPGPSTNSQESSSSPSAGTFEPSRI
jgi:hypothetical protein